MKTRDDIIIDREKGAYPISISTSLALESLQDIHPDFKHNRIITKEYTHFYINLKTLFRNYYTVLNTKDRLLVSVHSLFKYFLDEIKELDNWAIDTAKIKLIYYQSDLKYSFNKNTVLRKANTDLQKDYLDKQTVVINETLKVFKNVSNFPYIQFKSKVIGKQSQKALMLTHVSLDLLDPYSFTKLSLIESHTGRLKERKEWYTKYYDGNKLPELPFNFNLLQILGDKETIIPLKKQIRDTIANLAIKNKWTYMTSRERIKDNINQIENNEIKEIIKIYI